VRLLSAGIPDSPAIFIGFRDGKSGGEYQKLSLQKGRRQKPLTLREICGEANDPVC